ncbi:MAG: bacterio-opsin activator domain-containing protein [Haloferacaceae archaeon]
MAESGGPSDTAQETGRADTPPTSAIADNVDEALKTRAMDEAPVGITVADARAPDMPLVYANAAFERITGYPPERAVGENCRFLQGPKTRDESVARMRRAIEAEEPVSVELRNYRKDGDLFWNEVTLAPLRNEAGEVTHYVGFQQDVTRRKRAEQAAARRATRIERERAAQERLLERLDGVVVDVTEAVTGAASRSELERAVADRLAATYAGAWVGRYDPAEETVVPAASAGTAATDQDPVSVDGDGNTASAVRTAVEDRHVRIESVAGETAVAAIPLYYGDATYGAVCVHAGGAGFEDHERAVLSALGRTVATGINSQESRRALQAEEAVELQFTLLDHPLVALATDLDCRLEYVGSVGDRDRPTALFELAGVDGEQVPEAAAGSAVDVEAVLFDGSDGCLVELALPDTLRDLFADHGADLREAAVEDGTARFTVEVARESLARSLADAVTDRFEGADLVGYRQRERRRETGQEFVDRLRNDLTERQHAALVRAYTGGFFEWPHEATGDDLAEAMGVCRSTFHQHLRAAQRKLVGAVLDRP